MLQIIIFSFNRALQLDTLLTSIKEKWLQPSYKIDILYNASNTFFQDGYELLIHKYSSDSTINFHKESSSPQNYSLFDFLNLRNLAHFWHHKHFLTPKSNFRTLCNSLIKNDKSKFVMFLTDDAMFIKDVNIDNKILNWIKEKPTQRQYSLRLGLGMNGQNSTVKQLDNHIIYWNFYDNAPDTNWGYPFSVDAHLYSKKVILGLFSKYIFCNPNTLEAYINAQVKRKTFFGEGMADGSTSILSFPINMVQTIVDNESLGVDCELLNNWFLDGYTMKYPIPSKIDTFQQYPNKLYLYRDGKCVAKDIK